MTPVEWAVQAQLDEIPFVRKGRSRQGLDCWGLVWLLYQEVYGILLPDYADLYEEGDVYKAKVLEALIEPRKNTWDKIEIGEEQPGDGILFTGKGSVPHVGVVVKPGTMVHIEEGTFVSIISYSGIAWKPRLREIRRYRSPCGELEPV